MNWRRRKLGRRRRRRRFMSDVLICELCKSVRKIPVLRRSSRRWRGGLRLDALRLAVHVFTWRVDGVGGCVLTHRVWRLRVASA